MSIRSKLYSSGVRCTIQRNTGTTKNPYNQTVPNWTDLATNVPCLLDETQGKELPKEKDIVITDATLFLLGGQDITEDDRVVVGSVIWEVLYVGNPGGKNHHKECAVRRVKT